MPATSPVLHPTSDHVLETFRLAQDHFGRVPNLVRVLASNETLCRSITQFFSQALRNGRVQWAFKELVILKTLRAIGAYYSYGAHERLAIMLGNSEDCVGDLCNSLWQTSPHFGQGQRAVFELVEQIAADANDASQALWDRLKSSWDEGQLLELTTVITTFVMIGRLGDTLGVSEPVLFAPAKLSRGPAAQ